MIDSRSQGNGECTLRYAGIEIPVVVSFGTRKTLKIAVHPDLRVVVSAPKERTLSEVLAKVEQRGRWILKQRRYFEQFQPRLPEKRYVSGETFLFLGRQYRLKVVPDTLNRAVLRGGSLEVHGPARDDHDAVKALVVAWYRKQARSTFERRLRKCSELVRRHGIPQPTLRIRRMKRRWGSCGKNGTMLLNTELVRAPVHCIDYVIVHELCHLRFPRHDARFYRLLAMALPDWQKRKKRLEQVLV
mgnify:CR=1 FL=1